MQFKIESPFLPTGDQPEAIRQIVSGFSQGEKYVTLQGVTGSGKTFTVANAVQELQRPTLVLAHNKTLAAQLYSEFMLWNISFPIMIITNPKPISQLVDFT